MRKRKNDRNHHRISTNEMNVPEVGVHSKPSVTEVYEAQNIIAEVLILISITYKSENIKPTEYELIII